MKNLFFKDFWPGTEQLKINVTCSFQNVKRSKITFVLNTFLFSLISPRQRYHSPQIGILPTQDPTLCLVSVEKQVERLSPSLLPPGSGRLVSGESHLELGLKSGAERNSVSVSLLAFLNFNQVSWGE